MAEPAKGQFEYSVATMPPTMRQRRLAFVVVVVTLAMFGAAAPFAGLPLQRFDSFVPAMAGIIFVTDLVTAVLLFSQFSTTGSRALLVLASGYFFTSLTAIPFALSFPGAFAPTGLLGAGSQSAAWLALSIRFGFAMATVGYAFLTSGKHEKVSIEPSPRPAILCSVAIIIVVVGTLIWAVTAGHDLLPRLLLDGKVLPLAHYATGMVALLYILAVLVLWPRRKSVLDLWLMVAVCALIAELLSIALFAKGRFDVGFYANRTIPLVVSKVVLIALLSETVMLHARLSFANRNLQRAKRIEGRLAAIVESSDDAIISKDLNGVITTWNAAAERMFGYSAAEAIGQPIMILIPPERQNEELEILARIHRGEHVDHFETIRKRKDGSPINVSLSVSPISDESGKIFGASKIARDITDQKRTEERQKVLMAELDHRVKNVLARVDVVAMSTSESSNGVGEFVRSLRGRIQSMAIAHKLLSESRWLDVGLTSLVDTQLRPYETYGNITISGTDLTLAAAEAQAVAMVLHELVTNAAKYGALSVPEGQVSVSWDHKLNGNATAILMLEWRELRGPPVATEVQSGYGTGLIRDLVPHELGGKVDLVFDPGGVICRIAIPLSRVEQR